MSKRYPRLIAHWTPGYDDDKILIAGHDTDGYQHSNDYTLDFPNSRDDMDNLDEDAMIATLKADGWVPISEVHHGDVAASIELDPSDERVSPTPHSTPGGDS